MNLSNGSFGFGGSGGSGGGGGGGTYNGASPSTVDVNDIPAGTDIAGSTYDYLLENIYAPYTAPVIAVDSLSPATSNFDQEDVTIDVSFSWQKTAGSGFLLTAQIEYKRSSDVSWTNLTTSLSGTTTDKIASASVTVNSGAPNNESVQFRCIFTDLQSNTSPTATATFQAYAAPTAALSIAFTPTLQNGKLIRSIDQAYEAVVGGTITRNSANVDLSQYKIQRDYNDSVWTDISSLTSIAAGGGAISPDVTDSDQTLSKDAVRYRAFVEDAETPAGQAVAVIDGATIYEPILSGMSTSADIAGIDVADLTPVADGTGAGEVNYSNTSADKSIDGLVFTASSNRFCFAFPSSYGTITQFLWVDGNVNLLSPASNFLTDTKNVTFADGTMLSYRFYLYNAALADGSYTINTQ